MSASGPSVVEKPTPSDSSPVDCSSTSTVTTVLSGAEPGLVGHLDFLEEAKIFDALLRALHLGCVERVALDQLELAADHLVECADVADDVDPLDVDLRPFLHVECDVDRALRGCG